MPSKRKPDETERWVADQTASIRGRLAALGDPERAAWDREYLRSELTHLGVSLPNLRASARAVQRELGELPHARRLALLEQLWSAGVHDLRSFAVALVERWAKQLDADDLAWIERWLIEANTWALVDWLAVPIVGSIVERSPERAHPVLDRWALDSNFWLRRSAMLALLVPLRKAGGEFDRFAGYALAMLPMTREEPAVARKFIDKTIGWILREVGRKRPGLVREFLDAQLGELAGLSVREAIKSLPAGERASVLARWAEVGQPRRRAAATRKSKSKRAE
ncbi:DNA alkylation repair protein [Nannocystaceae bacterium ST9]